MSVVRAAVVLSILLGAATGCGVPLQDEAQPFTVPSTAPPSTPPQGDVPAVVFLVRDGRMIPVPRAGNDASVDSLIDLLEAGPTREESERGLRSALLAGSVDRETGMEERDLGEGVITVSLTHRFTTITGEDQLLATAQLVWTVTQRSPSRAVRAELEGQPIELPTDTGLAEGPVRRSDYSSVRPDVVAQQPNH